MFDLLIKGGKIVDGSGQEPFSADIGIKDGKIVSIGKLNDIAQETIDADGAIVTPGFVDIHTHYDGQVSWDETFSPSIYHGVTTVVMGNCGVGFAPVQPGSEDRLISLMEGVEDIPGTALAEGICWGWTSFAEYVNYLPING
ncbi:MAG: amidohydrolase [bacterium]|nr:MAG: amidohydrolase [bacterium]